MTAFGARDVMPVVETEAWARDGQHEADIVVVGSGPAGAAVARELARAGASVLVLEEGPAVAPADFPEDGFSAMARLYRGMGSTVTMGNAPMPYLQGRLLGGGSAINGAISWRLPRDVWEGWVRADPALEAALPWAELEAETDRVERDLGIAPTDPAVAGPHNLAMARGAEALGLEHRPIARNVSGCRGLGRCLQGCPGGHKQSMERTLLPEAVRHGARVVPDCRVERVETRAGRAVGVRAVTVSGRRVRIRARRAVVLAASAVQTPCLLLRSGIRHGPVGDGFACHPGASMAGRFPEPMRLWEGATQGHEVTGLRREGIKFEALGFDLPIAASRLKGFGRALSAELTELPFWANWGAAIRAEARGRVRPFGRGVRVSLNLTPGDMRRVRRGLAVLGEMMLAAGALHVAPGVYGFDPQVTDRSRLQQFALDGPLDPKAYAMAVTHMFGTCRMGSDPARSVVRPDFRHQRVENLYVADSSVFPSNTGVNPQTSIIVLARRCAQGLATTG